jgi:hypothetical protein
VDEWGVIRPRLPIQLAGGLLSLLFFWLLDWASHAALSRRWVHPQGRPSWPIRWARRAFQKQGAAGCILCFLLCAVTAGLSWLRADPAALLLNMRVDVLAWAALALACALAFFQLTNSGDQR